MALNLDEALKNLDSWVKALAYETERVIPVVKRTMAGEVELPQGCPSKASMAEMELRQVKKK